MRVAEIITFIFLVTPRAVTKGISHAGSVAFGISLEQGFVVFLSVYRSTTSKNVLVWFVHEPVPSPLCPLRMGNLSDGTGPRQCWRSQLG